jgi:hypothetical protein
MAKQASTVNLEEMIWNEIEKYMKEKDVNRNTAIEWMIIERKALLERLQRNQAVAQQPKQVEICDTKTINLEDITSDLGVL